VKSRCSIAVTTQQPSGLEAMASGSPRSEACRSQAHRASDRAAAQLHVANGELISAGAVTKAKLQSFVSRSRSPSDRRPRDGTCPWIARKAWFLTAQYLRQTDEVKSDGCSRFFVGMNGGGEEQAAPRNTRMKRWVESHSPYRVAIRCAGSRWFSVDCQVQHDDRE